MTIPLKESLSDRSEAIHQKKHEIRASAGSSLANTFSNIGASFLKGKGSTEASQRTVKGEFEELIESIRALSGNKWEIRDVLDRPLKGRYSPNDHLCRAVFTNNTGSIVATLNVFPKDINLKTEFIGDHLIDRASHTSPNKLSVMRALTAKELKSLNATSGSDHMVIGSSRLEFKKDERV